jgi:RING finger protein 113A
MSDANANADAARQAASAAPSDAGAAKRKSRGNLRKRQADSDEDAGAGAGAGDGGVVRKAARQQGAPLAFSTKREDKAEVFKFESSNAVQVLGDGGATRALETETEYDRDNRALRERALRDAGAEAEAPAGGDPAGGGGAVYRGMTGYKDYRAGFRSEQTVGAEKAAGSHGPLRASAHVRMSIRVDYQPDVCKDYKETGYCGFGDSCKFLHDRGDYKAGWEIDREWDAQQKAKRERVLAGWRPDGEGSGGDDDDDEEDDGLPFACLICRRPWAECQDPVVTRCRHHFCEQCALQHNAKSSKCAVCEQPTRGIFNVAADILKKEKERAKKAKEAAGGGG